MQYILRAGPKAYAITLDNGDTIITPNYEKATKFPNIGDAMRAATLINETLDSCIFEVCRL